MWKLFALAFGFREARDAEDGRLVVWGHGVHFYSWKDAVLYLLKP